MRILYPQRLLLPCCSLELASSRHFCRTVGRIWCCSTDYCSLISYTLVLKQYKLNFILSVTGYTNCIGLFASWLIIILHQSV